MADLNAAAAVNARQPPWQAYCCLAGAMALVGAYVGLSKWLVLVFPVFLLAWLRFGIAAVAMAHWVRRQPGDEPLNNRDRKLLFFESFFGNFLFSICMLFGVSLTSAVAAGIIMAAIPAVVAVLSWLLLQERITKAVLGGIACAVSGIALVSLTQQSGDHSSSLLGNLLLVGAVVCEALYVVLGKKLTGRVSAKRISALVNLWGLLLVTPLGLYQAYFFDFEAVQPNAWALLIFYALAASMWTVWLWMTGLKHIPASRAGIYTVLLPITAALVGVVALDERFTATQVAAFGLALGGVVLATWPTRVAKADV